MTTIVSLIARKGGVGKTTLSVNLAAGCGRRGLRTLLIDADGQGNASSAVRVKPHDGFHRLILGDEEFADVIIPCPPDFDSEAGLSLISSWNMQREVEQHQESAQRIFDRLSELRGVFDVVIIDTSPGITEVHTGLYYASDYVVIPTQLEYSSIKSLESTFAFLASAQKAGEPHGLKTAAILGIVPNMYAASETVQRENYGYLKGRYSERLEVFDFLRSMTVWRQSAQFRQSIYQYTPLDYAAKLAARRARAELDPIVNAVAQKAAVAA